MIGPIIAAVVIVFVLVVIVSGYKKAPPDTAYIISGLRKKVIIGKASVKIPFLERMDKLSLKLIAIDVKTSNAVPTADYINIQVDAAVNIKISSEKDKLALAAENFLNQNTQYIASIAREVLEGNMREIVGRMRLEEMVSDRQKFANLVKENAEPDLAAMGLDYVELGKQTGEMAAKVLKGEAKASELNFETIKDAAFYGNTKVAENLGITLPESLTGNAAELFDSITE